MRPVFEVTLNHLECMVVVFRFFNDLTVVSRDNRVSRNHNIDIRIGFSKLPHLVVQLLLASLYYIVDTGGIIALWQVLGKATWRHDEIV